MTEYHVEIAEDGSVIEVSDVNPVVEIAAVGVQGPPGPQGNPGAKGDKGDKGDPGESSGGASPLTDLTRPAKVGRWYNATPAVITGNTFQNPGLNNLYMTLPRIATETLSIDAVAMTVNIVGGTGAVCRLGIWEVTIADPYAPVLGAPYASLLLDAGTVATDGSAGSKVITLGTPLVIPAGTVYAFSFVDQVATPCRHSFQTVHGFGHVGWGMSGPLNADNGGTLRQSSVTGALPATFVPAAHESPFGWDGGIAFRRSA